MEDYQWPVTLHSDIGCDIRIAPKTAPEDLPMGASESAWDVVNRECQVPKDELDLAAKNFQFWKDLLDDHYPAFFDVKTNVPKENFIKIQHLQVCYMTCISVNCDLRVTHYVLFIVQDVKRVSVR